MTDEWMIGIKLFVQGIVFKAPRRACMSRRSFLAKHDPAGGKDWEANGSSLSSPISLSCQVNWQGKVKLKSPGKAGYVHWNTKYMTTRRD